MTSLHAVNICFRFDQQLFFKKKKLKLKIHVVCFFRIVVVEPHDCIAAQVYFWIINSCVFQLQLCVIENERYLLCCAKFDGDRRIFVVACRLSSPSFQSAISSTTSSEFICLYGIEQPVPTTTTTTSLSSASGPIYINGLR
jgi:hypothetical protein